MNKTNQTVSREQRIAESNACASEETLRNQEILNNENERTQETAGTEGQSVKNKAIEAIRKEHSRRETWQKIADQHYARIGPCPYFGNFGSPGGHIYGRDDQDEHCQLCGQPKPETAPPSDQPQGTGGTMNILQLTYPKHRSEQRAFLKGNTMSLQWAMAAFSQALGYQEPNSRLQPSPDERDEFEGAAWRQQHE